MVDSKENWGTENWGIRPKDKPKENWRDIRAQMLQEYWPILIVAGILLSCLHCWIQSCLKRLYLLDWPLSTTLNSMHN